MYVVSAIVSTYNSEKFIKGCLEDLTSQTLFVQGKLEIIVVNSGSRENEESIVRPFVDRSPHIRYVKTSIRETVYAAWNRGIRIASGKYITNANTDDRHRADALEIMSRELERNPDIGLVYADVVITEKENETFDHCTPVGRFQWFEFDQQLLAAVCFMGPQPMWRRSLHDKFGFFDEAYTTSGDWEFWLRIAKDVQFKHIAEALGLYLQSEQSVEHRGIEMRIREDEQIHGKYVEKYWTDFTDVETVLRKVGILEAHGGFDVARVIRKKAVRRRKGLLMALSPRTCREVEAQDHLTSIVIVSCNQVEQIKQRLDNIAKATAEPYEIIFVDTNSGGESRKWLERLCSKGRQYRLIRNGKHRTSAACCNDATDAARGSHILIMDSGVVPAQGWLSGMLFHLQSAADVGVVGPCVSGVRGPQSPGEPPGPTLEDRQSFAIQFAARYHARRIPIHRLDRSCFLFRKSLVAHIGLFDDSVDNSQYAADFCMRAALAGYKNILAADVVVFGSDPDVYGEGDGGTESDIHHRQLLLQKWNAPGIQEKFGRTLKVQKIREQYQDELLWGKTDAAIDTILGGMKQFPDEPIFCIDLAQLHCDAQQFETCLTLLNDERMQDNEERRSLLRIECLIGIGKIEEAEQLLLTLESDGKKNPFVLNLKGVLANAGNQHSEAERWWREAATLDPSNSQPLASLGALRWNSGDEEGAMDLLERGFNLSPLSLEVLDLYFLAAMERGETNRLKHSLLSALSFYPKARHIRFKLIELLSREERFAEALEHVRQSMAYSDIEDGFVDAALHILSQCVPMGEKHKTQWKKSLSLCMIVKNEQNNIAKALLSASPWVDEMVVVDTGSTDRTKDIARVYGARVFEKTWNKDFSEARNYSFDLATCEMIVILDADEIISASDWVQLRRQIDETGNQQIALTITTRNYVETSEMIGWVGNQDLYEEEKGSGWFPSTKVRVFPHDPRIRMEGAVHEMVSESLKRAGIAILQSTIPVHHHGKLDAGRMLQKQLAYYELGKKKILETGENSQSLKELAIQADELKKYDEALELWARALALEPTMAFAHYMMGSAYIGISKFDEAMKSSQKALEFSPDLKDARFNYGLCLVLAGKREEARESFSEIFHSDQDYAPARAMSAALDIIEGKLEEGREALKKLENGAFQMSVFMSGFLHLLEQAGRTSDYEILLQRCVESGILLK